MNLSTNFGQFKKNSFFKSAYSTYYFCLITIFLTGIVELQAQPANDLCENAELVMAPANPGERVFAGSGSTLTATSTNFPPSCGSGVDNSTSGGIWYTFEGESSTLYSLSTCHSSTDFDTELSIHSVTGSGSCMTDMACLVGNDNASCSFDGTHSTVSIFTPAGFVASTYYVYVTGEGVATGNVQLSLTNGPPLPVELISFSGNVEERVNRLSWKTASEFNTERHALERSLDGKSNWQEIGSIDAVGFTSAIQHYEFEDFDPPPKVFYRLRSIDFDGEEGLSEIVVLERETTGFDSVVLTPNPTRDLVSLSFNLKKKSKVVYTIMNMQGRVIRKWTSNVAHGIYEERIDLSDLQTGVYLIQLNNGTEISSKRILRL